MEKNMRSFGRALLIQLLLYLTATLLLPLLPKGMSNGLLYSVILKTAVFLPPIIFYIRSSGYRITEKTSGVKQSRFSYVTEYVFGLSLTVTLMNSVGVVTSLALGNTSASGFTEINGVIGSFVTSVMLASIFEEILFRGAFFHASAGQSKVFCVAVSGLLFALMHYSLLQFFYALSAGLVIAFFYKRNGSLLFSVLLHAGANFMTWLFTVLRSFGGNGVSVAQNITAAVFAVIAVIGTVVFAIKRKKVPDSSDAADKLYISTELLIYIAGAVLLTVFKVI